jgi:hypothetical protein
MNQSNPFIYSTPDQIKNPKEALDLFVDVLRDFYLIESPGNTFINGPRGSGKSMMFRIMKPDCQKVSLGKNLAELNYFSIYIPIKNTSLNVEELKYLSGKHGENILNEHFLTTYFSIAIFERLKEENYSIYGSSTNECLSFYNNVFLKCINRAGNKKLLPIENKEVKTPNEVFTKIISVLEEVQDEFSNYLERLTLGDENLKYTGSLCLFRNFLFPLIQDIVKFSFLPKDKPLYLMIDDADLLSVPQTKILNSWVSYRFTAFVCYKISTQLNYKTYYTSSGDNKIDSPHDFHEINLSEIYTSNIANNYKDNLKSIVEKRLKLFSDINISAEEFLPADEKQIKEIDKIHDKLESENSYDFAYRNARPDYMLSLKNEYSYNYGGFEQLVHLSSGIIRNFIDLSFKMFDKTVRANSNNDIKITSIPYSIQNDEIREYGNWILQQLDKSINDEHLSPIQSNKFKLLRNLIDSMGKAFRLYLESNSTERRKIVFYFDGDVSKEIKDVLKLGVSEGLFHESTHGSKTGLGRSKKYVMNRMLAPIYKLDPFSFSGYLYITPEKLELAINNEKAFLQYIKERIKKGDKHEDELQVQTKLDF